MIQESMQKIMNDILSKMKVVLLVRLLMVTATLFSIGANADTDSAGRGRGDKPRENTSIAATKSYHQLSLGLMVPVGGGAGSMNDSCGLYEEEACPAGRMAPIPGISFSYDFRPYKYLSIGTSVQYQSYWAYRYPRGHQAEILKLGLFARGLLPLAQQRVDLYFLFGFFPSLAWIWSEESYYEFQTEISFGVALGARFWVTKRVGIYGDVEMYYGGLGENALWYVPVGVGIVFRF